MSRCEKEENHIFLYGTQKDTFIEYFPNLWTGDIGEHRTCWLEDAILYCHYHVDLDPCRFNPCQLWTPDAPVIKTADIILLCPQDLLELKVRQEELKAAKITQSQVAVFFPGQHIYLKDYNKVRILNIEKNESLENVVKKIMKFAEEKRKEEKSNCLIM